jgi:hypothetical protein
MLLISSPLCFSLFFQPLSLSNHLIASCFVSYLLAAPTKSLSQHLESNRTLGFAKKNQATSPLLTTHSALQLTLSSPKRVFPASFS